MLFLHKTNPNFMFNTSKGLRRFNNGKLELEKELIETIKKTEDFKFGLIEMEEVIKPIEQTEEVEVETIETEEVEKPKKRKTNKK